MVTDLVPRTTVHDRADKRAILVALCLGALIINVDVTIVNVTLPSLVRELHAATATLQWVVDAYTLVFASLILAAGSLSDRLGRKGLLLAGLAVFAAGSLAGALSHTSGELIASRVVMGIGAAAIFPSTLSILSNVFTARAERVKAIGAWGATTGVGIAIGPILGGWLLAHFWWGSVFLFMVPLAAVVAAMVAVAVPTSRDPSTPPIDRTGLVLSTTGMALVLLGIIQGPSWGWSSGATLGALASGLAILVGFVLVERRLRHPMLDVRLFRNLRFTAASGSVTISFFALAGFTFLVTQYFQFVRGFTPLGTGVRILPVAVAVATTAIVGTRLTPRLGNKAVVAAGLAAFGLGLLWISTNDATTSYGVIALQMVVAGGGMGLITAPATEAILGVVPKEKAGVGSAVNDATRLFGAALGVAVIGSVSASAYSNALATTLPAHLPAPLTSVAHQSVGAALGVAHRLAASGRLTLAGTVRHDAWHSFVHAMSIGCLVGATAALVGAVVAAVLLPARPGATVPLPREARVAEPVAA